jgi:cobalt/nickel transport system permease protein
MGNRLAAEEMEEPVNHSFIDEHSNIESPLSRLDPRVKIAGFIGLVICIALTGRQSFQAYFFYGILVASLAVVSRIPLEHILKRSLVIMPFILMLAVFIPFQGGDVIYRIGPVPICRTGLLLFSGLAVKSFLSVVSIIVLTAGTPFTSLLKGLQDLRVPSIIIMVMSFMYRYFFIIEDEFMKMKQARESRSAGKANRLRFRSLANMIGVLFIRAYERSESVYMAMCSRGFTGKVITAQGGCRLNYRDLAFLAIIALSVSGIHWFDFNG